MASHQGLPPRDADFGYAKLGDHTNDPEEFLVSQDLPVRNLGVPLEWPAVYAVEVAMVGDGNSKITQPPVVRIYQFMPFLTACFIFHKVF
jgi:hypothetical protein